MVIVHFGTVLVGMEIFGGVEVILRTEMQHIGRDLVEIITVMELCT
jgi:hypothetical protein